MIYKFLSKVEQLCAKYQGKGWGSSTIKQEVSCLKKILKQPGLGIDIGGNLGNYTAELRKIFADMEIHVFEPSVHHYATLVNKFKEDDKIKINRLAVSNSRSTAVLYANAPGSGLASLTQRNLAHLNIEFDYSEPVETIRLDDYWHSTLNERDIDFIKIDVEGHELNVLMGLGEAIHKTKAIQFEFGGCNIDTKTYFQDYWNYFESRNFKIYRITPIGLQPIGRYTEADEYFLTTNFLCLNQKY